MSKDFSDLLRLIEAGPNPDDVFRHELLNDALRDECAPLLAYLGTDAAVDRLASWCFDLSMMTDPNFNAMSRLSVKLFTSGIPRVFEIFLHSARLAEHLHDFLASDASTNPLLCGFFSRVMGQQVRWGDPQLFKQYDDIGTLLLRRLNVLAIQELIVTVGSKPELPVFKDCELVYELTKLALQEGDDAGGAFTIIQLYDNLSDDSPVFEQFFAKPVVQNLLELCLVTKSIIASSDVIDIVSQLVEMDESLYPVVDEYKPRLLVPGVINQCTAGALRMFTLQVLEPFTLFFEPRGYIFVHYYCSQLLAEMRNQDIIELAQSGNFLDQLMDCFGTPKWCPHMTHLSITFIRVLERCEDFHYDRWSQFVENQLSDLVKALDAPFGGPVPEPGACGDDDDDDYGSEEEEYEYEEDEMDIGMDDDLETSDSEDEDE